MTPQETILTILKSEAKDILKKHGTPDINLVQSSHDVRESSSSFNPWGINILTLANNGRKAPLFISNPWLDGWSKDNIRPLRWDQAEYRLKIPGKSGQYIFSGGFLHNDCKNLHLTEYKNSGTKLLFYEKIERFGASFETKQMPAALLYDNTAVLYWTIDGRNDTTVAMIRWVLEELLAMIDTKKFPPQMTEETKRQRVKSKYLEFRSNETKELTRLVQEEQETVIYHQGKLGESILKLKKDQKRLELFGLGSAKLEEDFNKFMERMSENKKIDSFDIQKDTMTIETKDLVLTWGKRSIKLPPYVVTVNLGNGNLTVSSKDPLPFSPIHPHVFSRGDACHGNFTEIFPKILASGNLQQVVDYVLVFLQTYNPSSPVPGADWLPFSVSMKYGMRFSEAQQLHGEEVERYRKDLAKDDRRYGDDDEENEEVREEFEYNNDDES